MYGPAGPRQGTAQGFGMTQSQLDQADALRHNSAEAVAETREEVNVETAQKLEQQGEAHAVSGVQQTTVCGVGANAVCRTVTGHYTPSSEEAPHGFTCVNNGVQRSCTVFDDPAAPQEPGSNGSNAWVRSTEVCRGSGTARACETKSGHYTPSSQEAPHGYSCVTMDGTRSCSIQEKPVLAAGFSKFVSVSSEQGWWMIVAGVLAILIGALLIYFGVKAAQEFDALPEDGAADAGVPKPSAATTWLTTAAITGIIAAALSLFNPVSSGLTAGILWVFAVAVIVVSIVSLVALDKYKKGEKTKGETEVAKASANMTIALGALNYIAFAGVPLLAIGSMLVIQANKAKDKLEGGQS